MRENMRLSIALAVATLLAPSAVAQQDLGAIKQAVASNQRALAGYTWKQRTEMSQDGEVRNVRVEQVRFGADGEPHKTLLNQPVAPKQPRGLRGRLAAGKIADMKDYIERLMSLSQRYLLPPPFKFPEMMKKAEIWQGRGAAGNVTRLEIRDFVKTGDEVTLTLDGATKRPRGMEAKSELDGDEVRIEATYGDVPNGPTYLASMTVDGAAKKVQIRIDTSDYQRLTQATSASVVIPSGTSIRIRMIDSIDSDASGAGSKYRASLDDPIVVGSTTVAPQGADAMVEVVRVEQSGTLKGSEEVALRLADVTVGGRTVAVSTNFAEVQADKSRGGQSAKRIGGGAAAGAVVGGILGGGKGAAIGAGVGAGAGTIAQMASGQRVRIESETRLEFTLEQNVPVP